MQKIDINKIIPYSKNAKTHPKAQIKKIANSIKEFGFNQPIVIDKDFIIIVGHGRHEAAKLLEMTEVPCLQVDLTEEQAKSYRLADNKLSESPWEMELVIEELRTLPKAMIDLSGFSTDLILKDEPDDDDVPEIPKKAKSKLGEIYKLGIHRLMCGSSTESEDVKKLMNGKKAQMCFTDPPYNVDYNGSHTTEDLIKQDRKILNDKMTKDEFYGFLSEVNKQIIKYVEGGVYICMSSSELDTLKKSWEDNGGHWQSFIVWVKNNFTLSRSDYQHTYEPILYGWPAQIKNHYFIRERNGANVWEDLRKVKTEFKDGYTWINFQGFKIKIKGVVEKGEIIKKRQRTDIWRYDKPVKSPEHPTMKPVALCDEAIRNSSSKQDIVLDLFGGSGSTLISCEKLARKCYMMELDPLFIDVIIKRYEQYTGNEAVKITTAK